ncbi:MAG: hypothetical protein JWM91_1063 [Rhodospirillales bacterium]|nr:hypothetical protein [Rhodospirillales bacterium]
MHWGLFGRGLCFILPVFIAAKGIDDLDAREIALVIGDRHTVIGRGDGGDDHVQWAARPPAFVCGFLAARADRRDLELMKRAQAGMWASLPSRWAYLLQ